jgi:hypothetical protein
LLLQVELIEEQIGLDILLEALGRPIFLGEDLTDEKLFCPFESFELQAKFSKIED